MLDRLGSLKRVDLRTQWGDEAAEFTPWLAARDNIARLSEVLGIELEVQSTEVAAGPYAADILARDTVTGDYVIVENQLGKTDHDHLGKVITYGAVLDAAAVVWVAGEFTEEHKKALDWLNDNSGEEVSYFGVVVELWQIDDSDPAVRFNVVSRPAGLARRSTLTKAGAKPLTPQQQIQLEWWVAFRDALLSKRIVTSAQTPRPQYWFDVALGRTGFHLSNTASVSEGKIGIRLYMWNKANAEAALSQLLQQREPIEREIGQPLEWNPNPSALDKTVRLTRPVDLERRDKWPEYLDWMTTYTSKFMRAFSPRVKQLELETLDEGASPEDEKARDT